MTTRSMSDMAEATRLTREGRLDEAMAVLRGALPGGQRSATALASDRDADRRNDHGSPAAVIDMLPPSQTGGTAWTAPRSEGAPERPPAAFLGLMFKAGVASGLERVVARGVTPAPAPLPQGAMFAEHDYADSAGRRTYKLYVPSRYTGQPLPLLVMLHGCTQSPDDFAAGTRMNFLAEAGEFLAVYPEQTVAANRSRCWNWFQTADQQRDKGEPALIAGITRQVMAEHAVDARRVYVAGLSAGGAMAAIMAVAYPDLYAAVGVHSGLVPGSAHDLPSALQAMQHGARRAASANAGSAIPLILFQGDSDSTVHPRNADEFIRQWVTTTSGEGQVTMHEGQVTGGKAFTRGVYRDLNGRTVVERWTIHGAGHAWAGGSSNGSYTDPAGPDASRELVRFFREH
jgi:poly(hydroxyalkanoate) depolymerase family esterase